MKHVLPLLLLGCATSALAEGNRQLDAHEHGVGELDIAIDGNVVAMELHAPGADIVGFEYAAESAEDRAAIDAALATLARPLELFQIPAAAECGVTQASAELESEEAHEDHDHDEHEHEHEEEHAEHDHDEHDHEEEHADGASHTEFHAEYMLACGNPGALTEIGFPYFDTFENARELEVQLVTTAGAQAFEVERSEPKLDLRGLF